MRRARKSINQINVVPYIDVMLVLLVIFMVTAPLVNPGEIELPSVGSKLTAPSQPLEVTLRTDGTILLRDQQGGGGTVLQVSRDELVARIRAKQAKLPDQPVVIAADKAARYEDVLGVLDLLQRNGVRKVGLLARPPSV
jgi:biopolymer transport protein TolR